MEMRSSRMRRDAEVVQEMIEDEDESADEEGLITTVGNIKVTRKP